MTSFETLLWAEISRSAHGLSNMLALTQKTALPSLASITDPEIRQLEAAHAMRVHLAQNLRKPEVLKTIPGWIPIIDPGRLMSIELRNRELGANIRILKERSRDSVRQTQIDERATPPEASYTPPLFGHDDPQDHKLLMLFDIVNPLDPKLWEVPSRIVRTVGDVSYGKNIRLDLNIPVVDEPGFYADREFSTTVPDTDFFATINRDENQRDQTGQA